MVISTISWDICGLQHDNKPYKPMITSQIPNCKVGNLQMTWQENEVQTREKRKKKDDFFMGQSSPKAISWGDSCLFPSDVRQTSHFIRVSLIHWSSSIQNAVHFRPRWNGTATVPWCIQLHQRTSWWGGLPKILMSHFFHQKNGNWWERSLAIWSI